MIGIGLGIGRRHQQGGGGGGGTVVPLDPATDALVNHWWRPDLGNGGGTTPTLADQRGTFLLNNFGATYAATDADFNGHASITTSFSATQLYTDVGKVWTPSFSVLVVGKLTSANPLFRTSSGTASAQIVNGTSSSTYVSTATNTTISSYNSATNLWLGAVPFAALLVYGGTHASHKVYVSSGASYGSLVTFTGTAGSVGDPGDASDWGRLFVDPDGKIADITTFNVALNASQIQSAFAYVFNRYGF